LRRNISENIFGEREKKENGATFPLGGAAVPRGIGRQSELLECDK
jgi:hypothetical protein